MTNQLTFCEFRKPTQSCRFLSSSIPKNFKFGGARARRTLVKVFMFKNCNTLTIITFFKFAKSFLLHQRTLAKKKIQNPIFNVFIIDLFKGEINYFLSSVLA